MGAMPIGLKFGIVPRRRQFMDDRDSYLAGLALWQQSDLSRLDT